MTRNIRGNSFIISRQVLERDSFRLKKESKPFTGRVDFFLEIRSNFWYLETFVKKSWIENKKDVSMTPKINKDWI